MPPLAATLATVEPVVEAAAAVLPTLERAFEMIEPTWLNTPDMPEFSWPLYLLKAEEEFACC